MHFSFQLKTEMYSSAHECTYIKQYASVVLLCITHMCLIMPLSFGKTLNDRQRKSSSNNFVLVIYVNFVGQWYL